MCESIGQSAFYICNISEAYIPNCKYIGEFALAFNKKLMSVNLTSVSVVPTIGYSTFNITPIGGYSDVTGEYGSVYVPASLYSAFIVAQHWSRIASRIVSVAA
jgi:hypothetical protein